VKYLHQRLGFDVLLWEGGFYDVDKSWRLIEAGENARTALARSIFGVWRVTETDELFDYIEKTARGPRPLIQAGIDNQLTGTASRDLLSYDLRDFLARVKVETRLLDDSMPFARALSAMSAAAPDSGVYGGTGYAKPDSMFLDSLIALRTRLNAARNTAGIDAMEWEFWQKLLENIETEARSLRGEGEWVDSAGVRRRIESRATQMGRNLVWLAQKRFPRRKIIVWAAAVHLLHRVPEPLPPEARCEPPSACAPGGKEIRSALGRNVYHMGFTHYEGSIGSPRSTRRWRVPQGEDCQAHLASRTTPQNVDRCTTEAHLEDLLKAAGHDNAFLDLRTRPTGGGWLDDPLFARPLATTFWRDVWPELFDGLFFIKVATPSSLSKRPNSR
jgi:erythromycin esterase